MVWFNEAEDSGPVQVLSHESDILLRRMRRQGSDGNSNSSNTILVACDQVARDGLNRLAHEYELTECLDPGWSLRPLELVQERGQTILVFEDPGGELLGRLLDAPLEIGRFLRLAIDISAVV